MAFGEVGLAGELRAVSRAKERIVEAARLGFNRCVLPYHNLKSISDQNGLGIELIGARNIKEAFEALNG